MSLNTLLQIRPHRRCRGMATFEIDPTPKKSCRCGSLDILHVGTAFSKLPFRPHMFATWAQHGSTNLQLSTTWTHLPQLRPNLGPTCRNLATSSTCLGATSAQAEPQHGDMAGPFLRNGSKLPNVGADLDLHVHSMASTWGQLAPTWAHRAHFLGAACQPGPILQTQFWKRAFFAAISDYVCISNVPGRCLHTGPSCAC